MSNPCDTGNCQHDSDLECSIEQYKYWKTASRGELLDVFVHKYTHDDREVPAPLKMALKERGLEMRNYANRAKHEVPNADKHL